MAYLTKRSRDIYLYLQVQIKSCRYWYQRIYNCLGIQGALNEKEQELFQLLQVHKPHTLDELVSYLEDYTINIEERRIRGCMLGLNKKGSDKNHSSKQDMFKPKQDANKAKNEKISQRGQATLEIQKSPSEVNLRNICL